jgi:hypothetical protein
MCWSDFVERIRSQAENESRTVPSNLPVGVLSPSPPVALRLLAGYS